VNIDQRAFQTIETNGIRLRAVVEGQGPLIVLVHGFPESWYSYRHQLAPLTAAGFRVAAIDVRGYGGSDKPGPIDAYSMRNLTSDVAGVIDALAGGQPAVLIGHDWGAPIVWATSILHREKVRAVVGMSVPHLGRPTRSPLDTFRVIYRDRFFYQLYFQEPDVAERELEADIPATLRMFYYQASADVPAFQRALLLNRPADAKCLDGAIDPDPLPAWLTAADVAYYAAQFRESGFRGPLNRYRNIDRDWRELTELQGERITQPSLFIAGEHDPVLSFVPGRNLVTMMDNFYTDLRGKLIVPKAGHWVQQEAPEAVNAALLPFLRSL
jgi:pimeloyl-ACP methyl ester carboxylesterase